MRQTLRIASWIAVWLVTRAFMVSRVGFWSDDGPAVQDVEFFEQSADFISANRALPEADTWQYPPGAGFLLLLPRLMPGQYAPAFIALALLADAVGLVALALLARREGRDHGVWLWLVGMPMLGVFPVLRFDIVPTTLAVVALVVFPGSAFVVGALAGLGAVVKLWPIAVLVAEWDRRRLLSGAGAAAGVIVAVVGAAWLAWGDPTGFVGNQGRRSLQAEAVAASPWHLVAEVRGRDVPYVVRSGTLEIDDPVAVGVTTALEWLTVVLAVAVAAWWVARERAIRLHGRRDLATTAFGRDAVFAAVLAAIVVSRVLSPQFMVWLVGLAAVVLATRDSRLRRPAWTTAVAIVLTSGLYLSHANFVLRNVVLLFAAVDAVVIMTRAVYRADRGPGAPAAKGESGLSPAARPTQVG